MELRFKPRPETEPNGRPFMLIRPAPTAPTGLPLGGCEDSIAAAVPSIETGEDRIPGCWTRE
jgi:hypothetical protein